MAKIEEYNGNGIIYEHKITRLYNKFTRKDDPNCYIKYEINETQPISIYIDTWVCFTTEPVGSGRILMKDLFEFIKEKYNDRIDDNTVVSLIPIPNIEANSRISAEKRTFANLIAYYKSINFDKEYVNEGSKRLSGTIGNIIQGITDYRKIGGKSRKGRKSIKGRKGRKSKKSRSYKRKTN
jgi:hypothetical protein